MTSQASNKSRRTTVQQTDSTEQSTLRSTVSNWSGDQVSRGAWFNAKLKNAADTFEFKTLCFYGTVTTHPEG